jgi:hypothetical protein
MSSPALGAGFVPVVSYVFPLNRSDKISPPSVLGAAGLLTNNGTRALFLAGHLYFRENTYQMAVAYGRGNLNYDLFGPEGGDSTSKLPLKQEGQFFLGEFLRRLGWKIFAGPRYFKGSSLVTVRPNQLIADIPLPPDLGLQTSLAAVGFRAQRDTRTNRFYPTSGDFLDLTSDFFSHKLGSHYSFQSYNLTFNKYRSLNDNQVLAYNFFLCGTGGQPPFYGNCIYGMKNELRGYVAGRYLARYMVATQLEYRLTLPWRFGLVGFGGVGGVSQDRNQPFRARHFLPAIGGGLRFQLSKEYHVNLRVDAALGEDSHTFSMGIAEAF